MKAMSQSESGIPEGEPTLEGEKEEFSLKTKITKIIPLTGTKNYSDKNQRRQYSEALMVALI